MSVTLAGGFALMALVFAVTAFISAGGVALSEHERAWGIAGIATFIVAIASATTAIWLAVAGF